MSLYDTLKIFNFILDPIFGFLLNLPPFWGIMIISLIVTLISTVIYKKMTDQEVLKTIKEDMKDLRKQMKEFSHDATKVAELQKISMQKSMIQMKESFKPMLVTYIPMLIIFAWLFTHLTYYPIMPDANFSMNLTFKDDVQGSVQIIIPEGINLIGEDIQTISNNNAGFIMNGKEGEYNVGFSFNNNSYTKDVLITSERKYDNPQERLSGDLKSITVSNEPVKIFGLSWFWSYIIFAILFNSVLRKLLKIH